MSLREDQIQRYSRQILLGAVGGSGQERLLERGARLVGTGQGIAVAGAYLAASGTPVGPPEGTVAPAQVGFLFGAARVGAASRDAWAEAVCALNADAARSPLDGGLVAELPAEVDGAAPWVVLAGNGEAGIGMLVLRGEGGCTACFALRLHGLSAPPGGAAAVQLGALAAVVFQRAALGIEREGVRTWRLGPSGALEVIAGPRCAQCS